MRAWLPTARSVVYSQFIVLLVLSVGGVGPFDDHFPSPDPTWSNIFTPTVEFSQYGSIVGQNPTKIHKVEIKQMKFIPENIFVRKGDRITFVNKDLVDHDVTELQEKKWTSSVLQPGKTWTMTATKNEDYYCSLHVTMKGKITIKK